MGQITVYIVCTIASIVATDQQAPAPDRQAPPLAMQGAAAATDTDPLAVQATAGGDIAAMLLDDEARRLSFQALLTNEQGGPIANPNGQHELDFRLYDSDAGGIPIGEVLDVIVTLNDGVVNAQIGPMDPTWFDGTARWMGVTVDNGTELTPLIALGAVPYAFRVDRVASEELDNDIALGDGSTSGSLNVYSGGAEPITLTLDGAAGRLRVGSPVDPGGITLHGLGQLMATRDSANTLVALYGTDLNGGGGTCLLGSPGGTTGLLLDGSVNGTSGGFVGVYTDGGAEAVSLSAANGTIRAGSINGGVEGNLHLHPAVGGPSRIYMEGNTGDLRLGLSTISSGDLRAYSSSGGIETIHLNGGLGHISLTDRSQETVRLDGDGGDGGGGILLWNSAGTQTLELDGDESDHAALRLRDAAGTTTVQIEARESAGTTGGQMLLRNAAGTTTIELDAEVGDAGPARIATSGRLGVGTLTPNHELVVQGDDPAMQIRDDTTDNSANAARIELLERAGGSYDGGAFLWWNGETNKLHVGTKINGDNTSVIVVDRATDGVGIGTQTPGAYRLAVNGAIRAKEIVVEVGWSDFVFEDDYQLATLDEVEAHIAEHGHLPDIPSAKEVEEHGVRVGEMESRLLQKVEELTLHLIDMNKRLCTLEAENEQLRREAELSAAKGQGGAR